MAVSDRAPQTLELADGVRVGRTMPRWLVLLSRRKITLIGAVIMIAIGALALLAPFVAGDPGRMGITARPVPPQPGRLVRARDGRRGVPERLAGGDQDVLPVGHAGGADS